MIRAAIITAALILLMSNKSEAQPINLTVDQDQSNVTFTILGTSDSSSLTGTGTIELNPTQEPFALARITELELNIADGFSISFLAGLVSATAEPGEVSVFLITAGPAAMVDMSNQFDQPGNEIGFSGVVQIFDPLGLAGGTGPLILDGITGEFDLVGVQLEVDGNSLSVSAGVVLDLPITDTITLNVDGSVVLAGVIPKPLPGDVNCDGVVNLEDVGPFVDLIISGGYLDKADINGDLSVDLLDVAPFVELLSGG